MDQFRKMLLGFLLFPALGLSASGSTAVAADDEVHINIAAGAYGAGYHLMSTAFAKVVQTEYPNIRVAVEATTGGGQANVRYLGRQEASLGIAGSDAGLEAYQGVGQFEGTKMSGLRTAWVGVPLQTHVIVLKDSEIKKVSDIKGKSIATCSAGTEKIYTPLFLKAHGIERSEYQSQYLQPGEAVEALRDNQIDAMVCPLVGPDPRVIDLATTREILLLSVDQSAIDALRSENAWWSKVTIPESFYPGVDEPVQTAGFYSTVFTHEGVSEDVMYKITAAIMEHKDELTAMYPTAGSVNLDQQRAFLEAGDPIPPLHSGVARYYREKGLLE